MTRRTAVAALAGVSCIRSLRSVGHPAYHLEPFMEGSPLYWGSTISTSPAGEIFVLDSLAHRIIIIDGRGRIERQIGQIGQEDGCLLFPRTMCLDRNGAVHVIDNGYNRLQSFSAQGTLLRGIGLSWRSETLATMSDGSFLVSAPETGTVISQIYPDGSKGRQFGRLIPTSRFWPKRSDADAVARAFNRALLRVTRNDEIYATYSYLPLVQKFDKSGDLIWERQLSGGPVEEFLHSCATTFECGQMQNLMIRNMDHVQLAVLVAAVTLDPAEHLSIVFGNAEVTSVSSSGEQAEVFRQNNIPVVPVTGLAWAGRMCYFLSPSSCYRMNR